MKLEEYYIIMMGEKLFLRTVEEEGDGNYQAKFTTDRRNASPFVDKRQAHIIIGKIGGELRTQFNWEE